MSHINVLKISHKPNLDLVQTLESLLERAKDGGLRGMAYATESVGGLAGTGWTSSSDVHVLKSAVMTLSARIAMDHIE